VADYTIQVEADVKKAKEKLEEVEKITKELEEEKKITFSENFDKVKENLQGAAESTKQIYGIVKKVPEVGERVEEVEKLAVGVKNVAVAAPGAARELIEVSKANNILETSSVAANTAVMSLVDNVAKIGFSLFAVKEAVGVLQAAYTGFFNNTIGREIQLQETILGTQTALASTSKVFRNGVEITDPLEKVKTLTSEVEERIDSIRTRSLELAGVTSQGIIDIFSLTSRQIGQVGGDLKDAEDLAISFSAALGTFGMPFYKARQEINSILTGTIGPDSELAHALKISNQDIAKARGTKEGIVGFIQKKLEVAVSGQSIAAKTFSGVTSNIAEIFEELQRKFGKGMLQPLLDNLTKVYNLLNSMLKPLEKIAETAGNAAGRLLSVLGKGVGGPTFEKLTSNLELSLEKIKNVLFNVIQSLQDQLILILTPLQNTFKQVTESLVSVGLGLGNLFQGVKTLSVEKFKTLAQVISNLASVLSPVLHGFGQLLNIYGDLIASPVGKYITQLTATFQVLDRIGVTAVTQLVIGLGILVTSWVPVVKAFKKAQIFIGNQLRALGLIIKTFVTKAIIELKKLGVAINSLNFIPSQVKTSLASVATGVATVSKNTAKSVKSLLSFNLNLKNLGPLLLRRAAGMLLFSTQIALVHIGVTALVDAWGKWQKHLDNKKIRAEALTAIDELAASASKAEDSLTGAERALRDLNQAKVDAAFNLKKEEIEKISQEIKKLEELAKTGTGTRFDPINRFFGNFTVSEQISAKIGQYNRELKKLLADLNQLDAPRREEKLKEQVKVIGNQRFNLERQIADFRRSLEEKLFRKRQSNARKEVEIFKKAGEIEIQRMERKNAELIEGEEGAAAVALQELNRYLSAKERGELDIEARKKELALTILDLEREVSNYRYETEKKIADIRKAIGKFETEVADYRVEQAKNEAIERNRDCDSSTVTTDGTGAGSSDVGGSGASGGISNALFGVTGNARVGEGWEGKIGVLDIGFPNAETALDDAERILFPALMEWARQGKLETLSINTVAGGTKYFSSKEALNDPTYLRRMFAEGIKAHENHRVGRVAIDIHGPINTPIPWATGGLTADVGDAGIIGNILDKDGNLTDLTVMHVGSGSRPGYKVEPQVQSSKSAGGKSTGKSTQKGPKSALEAGFTGAAGGAGAGAILMATNPPFILPAMGIGALVAGFGSAMVYSDRGKEKDKPPMRGRVNRNREFQKEVKSWETYILTTIGHRDQLLDDSILLLRDLINLGADQIALNRNPHQTYSLLNLEKPFMNPKGLKRNIDINTKSRDKNAASEIIFKVKFKEDLKEQGIPVAQLGTKDGKLYNKGSQKTIIQTEKGETEKEKSVTTKTVTAKPITENKKRPAKPKLDLDTDPTPAMQQSVDDFARLQQDFIKHLTDFNDLNNLQNKETRQAIFDNIIKKAFPVSPYHPSRNAGITLYTELNQLRQVNKPTALQSLDAKKDATSMIRMLGVARFFEKTFEDQVKTGKITLKEFFDLIPKYKAQLEKILKQNEKIYQQNLKNLELGAQKKLLEEANRERSDSEKTIRKRLNEISMDFLELGKQDKELIRQKGVEFEVEEKRIALIKEFGKITPESNKSLIAYKDALEKTTKAQLELKNQLKALIQKMKYLVELATTITNAQKNLVKDLITGGDFEESTERFMKSIADGVLNSVLDAAFKPMQDRLEDQLKSLFGLKNVEKDLATIQNDIKSRLKKEELPKDVGEAVATAMEKNTETSKTNLEEDKNKLLTSDLDKAFGNLEFGGIAGLDFGISPIKGLGDNDLWSKMKSPKQITESAWGGKLDLKKDLGIEINNLSTSMNGLKDSAQETGRNVDNATTAFDKFAAVVGRLGVLATSIALGIAGVNQIKEGGTYNTLMGIASIAGAGASLISGFGGFNFGSLFGGSSSSGVSGFNFPDYSGIFRSEGGSVVKDASYIVGELGPELFVPNQPGTVVPNDQVPFLKSSGSGGSVFDQAPAKGGSVFDQAPAILGELKVHYDSTVINNVSYVTTEQHERGMMQAAEQGRMLTLSALQNSPQIRRKVGI